MGLLSAVYDFPGELPSLEQIEQRIRDLTDVPLEREGSLDPLPTDEAQARLVVEAGRSTLLRSTHVKFRTKGDRRRGPRHIDLTVSLRGDQMCVFGNHIRLFPIICKALESLGGVVEVRQWKSR